MVILRSKVRINQMIFRFRWRQEMVASLEQNMKLRRCFIGFVPYARGKRICQRVLFLQRISRAWRCRLGLARLEKVASTAQSIHHLLNAFRRADRRRSAITIIQANLDGMRKRQLYAKRRSQMSVLQAHFRGALAQKELLERSNAARVIGRCFRGHSHRLRDHKANAASHKIVCAVRAWLVLLNYHRQQKSVAFLQRVWRRILSYRRMKKKHSAATYIAMSWRGCGHRFHHKHMQKAGRYLVTAAWMWKHMRLKRAKAAHATRIASVWRGYCVRANQFMLISSANKISHWWRNHKCLEETMVVIYQISLHARSMRQVRQEEHAVILQQGIRTWLLRKNGILLVKRMVLNMQSRFRAWGPRRDVEVLRAITGPHVKRLPSQLVALVSDKNKKLTRYRAFRSKERVAPHVARILRLKVLSPDLRADIDNVAGLIQSFLKFRLYLKRLRICQKLSRGWVVRTRNRRRHEAARRIQRAAVRKWLGPGKLLCRTQAAVKIQARVRGISVRESRMIKDWRSAFNDRLHEKMENARLQAKTAHVHSFVAQEDASVAEADAPKAEDESPAQEDAALAEVAE